MQSQFSLEIQTTIRAHRMLERGERLLVAVSGGADSVALLLALCELDYAAGVAHLNHGLRGADSDADEEFVKGLSESLGLPFFSRTITLSAEVGNIEAAGRFARRQFFEEVMVESRFDKTALAHNRNDRIETFLLHLLRGAGLEGLVSMAPMNERIIRPLIETDRQDIERYLHSRGQAWRTDVTNTDLAFARNRMRHLTIPGLAQNYNLQLAETLSRTIDILHEEDLLMRRWCDDWLREYASIRGDGVEVDAPRLAATPLPLVRRIIRMALKDAGSSLKDVTFDQIEHIRGLLQDGKSGKVVQIPGGIVAAREFDSIVFRRAEEMASDFAYELQIPGIVHIPELGRAFRAEIVDREKISSEDPRVFVDGGRLGPYVRIRNWRPGDYYRPVGLPAGKLKKLFQRARIPRNQRGRWPVFVNDSAIVWVASFPVSREFAPCGRSQKIVALEAVSEEKA